MNDQEIVIGDFRLDPSNACLWRGGEMINLSPKVFKVLSYLVRRAGQLVTRDELLGAVWPDTIVGEAALTVCVREIRKALGDRAGAPRYIETRHRHGYRLIAPTRKSTIDPEQATNNEAPPGLVGRAAELNQLQTWLDHALAGARQVIFVTGEPGIGKTTLVEAFRRSISAPKVLLAGGQCFEHHGPTEAYMPMLEAINQLCRQPGGERLTALFARWAPTWMAQLPWLGTHDEQQQWRRETLGATPGRMLREIIEALEALTAQTPLVLMIEDLHWSDYATLDLISALARRRERARLLLLGTYRPVEVIVNDHPLRSVNQDLQTHRHCRELPLELLTEAAVAEYLALRFPETSLPNALATLVHERTSGNPLFMVSVIADLAARGVLAEAEGRWQLQSAVEHVAVGVPESIRPMIEKQLAQLTSEELRCLEAASIAGMEFSAAAVAAVLGHDLVSVEESCERLARRRQFLRAAGVSEWPDGTAAGYYRFQHWLYQDVLYQRVTAARGRRFHLRLGERLEAAHSAGEAAIAAELANHFQRGGDYRRAIGYLRQAAKNATERFAFREAFRCLEQAEDLIGRLPEEYRAQHRNPIWELRGRLRRSTGNLLGSAEDFLELAACAGDGSEAGVHALLGAAASLFFVDRGRCLAVAEQAEGCSAMIGDPMLQAHARGQAAHWRLQVHGWREEDARAVYEAVDVARECNHSELLGLYLTLSAFHRCQQSDYRGACAAAEEGMPLTLAAGDAYHHMSGLCFSAWALMHLGEFGRAERAIHTGLALAGKNGHHLAGRVFQLFLAWLHEQALDFHGARRLCELGGDEDTQFGVLFGSILLGRAHLGLGEFDLAREAYQKVLRQTGEGAVLDWIWGMQWHLAQSECLLARGELAEGRREAEVTCALAAQSGERNCVALGRRVLAEVAIAEKDWDTAEAELTQALALADGHEIPPAQWRVYLTAARFEQQRRRNATAAKFHARGLAILQRLADSIDPDSPLRRRLLEEVSLHGRPGASLSGSSQKIRRAKS